MFFTADLDIDCDGQRTSQCNENTDCCFYPDTAFHTSTDQPLNAAQLPYVVLPQPTSTWDYRQYGIAGGSVVALIYQGKVTYAVVGDTGPTSIIGEASYATAVNLGIDPDPSTGGTEGPVTYVVFPDRVNPIENHSTATSVGESAASQWVGGSQSERTGEITGLDGKCVDVSGAKATNGSTIDLYDCNDTIAQQWTVGTDGTLRALGKCLDVAGAGTASGTKVQLYDCNGTGAQRWTANSAGQLVNAGSGKCLDATDKSSANGTPLQIWTCTSGSNQKWTVPSA